MIDIHTHLHLAHEVPEQPWGLSAEQLVDKMNQVGIDRSVLLPIESPEASVRFFLTEQAIEAAARYPERLIPFVSIDPRTPRAEEIVEYFAKTHHVEGFGELKNGLAFDDLLHHNIFARCSDLGLPVLFHSDPTLCWDEVGLPRMEKCLREFADLIIIGHGPGWWAAISADDDRRGGYPDGPIIPTGALDRLLGEYENLYADISAGSGNNALTRDPDFIVGFLERHWRKLLFGTDYLHAFQDLPQLEWLQQAPLTDEQREAIADGNARRILGLK